MTTEGTLPQRLIAAINHKDPRTNACTGMDAKAILPEYFGGPPSNQAAVDIFKGHWVASFPDECHAATGGSPFFNPLFDTRVQWVAGAYDFRDKSVLELGPLEGYHTKHLCDAGSKVIAVESNDIAYLKCLIAKEIMGIPAKFMFGEGSSFLAKEGRHFDLIWISGVLYHQEDPLEFLKLVCAHCDAVFIWTHYWQEGKVAAGLNFDPRMDSVKILDGCRAHYHYHTYGDKNVGFSGGQEQSSMWMEKHEIFEFFAGQGFQIKLELDFPDVFPGPCLQFLAQRI